MEGGKGERLKNCMLTSGPRYSKRKDLGWERTRREKSTQLTEDGKHILHLKVEGRTPLRCGGESLARRVLIGEVGES